MRILELIRIRYTAQALLCRMALIMVTPVTLRLLCPVMMHLATNFDRKETLIRRETHSIISLESFAFSVFLSSFPYLILSFCFICCSL